jgi:hypothetical protein
LGELDSVESAQLQLDAARPEASEVEDVTNKSVHSARVAIDRLEQGLPLLGAWLDGRVEEEANTRPHRRERRPQLVGDRREDVGPHPLDLGQEVDVSTVGRKGRAEHALAERCDVIHRPDLSRYSPSQTETAQLVEPGFRDAFVDRGIMVRQSSHQVRGCHAATDERECS